MCGIVNNAAVLLSTDLLASVSGTFDRQQKARWTYTPFGYSPSRQRYPESFTRTPTGVLFAGEYREAPGFYLPGNGKRAFLPSIMRFTCSDSMSPFALGGLNSYAYCGAQPVTRKDPSAQWFVSIVSRLFNSVKSAGVRVPQGVSPGMAGKAAPALIGGAGALEFARRRMPVLADDLALPPINWAARGMAPEGLALLDSPLPAIRGADGIPDGRFREAMVAAGEQAPELLRIENTEVRVESLRQFVRANPGRGIRATVHFAPGV